MATADTISQLRENSARLYDPSPLTPDGSLNPDVHVRSTPATPSHTQNHQ